MSVIEGKLDHIEQVNKKLQEDVDWLKEDVLNIDKNAIELGKGFNLIEDAFVDVNKELELVQSCVENIDNLGRKTDIRILKDMI